MGLSISQLGKGLESIAPEALGSPDTSSATGFGGKISGILPRGAGLVESPQHGDRSGIASILENSLDSSGQGGAMTAPAAGGSGSSGLSIVGGSQGEGKQLGESLLGGVSKFYNGASKATGMVAKLGIPEISQFAALGSVATKAASEGAQLGATKLEGGDMHQAESQALNTIGQTAENQIGSILPIPGGAKTLSLV